ncbi:MAG: hypothetical protein CMH26_01730 [Micavibrio sp.]|nr:hypothetical protein [Micavibrio sp.]
MSMKRIAFGVLMALVCVVVGAVLSKPIMAGLNEVSQRAYRLLNDDGKQIGYYGSGRIGQGTFFLFNPDGKLSAQIGSYENGSEARQSLLGLHDRDGTLRFLMRMYGPKDSPVIVMKDKTGDDTLLIGLDGADEVPFIRYRSRDGSMKDLINEQ